MSDSKKMAAQFDRINAELGNQNKGVRLYGFGPKDTFCCECKHLLTKRDQYTRKVFCVCENIESVVLKKDLKLQSKLQACKMFKEK